MTFNPANGDYFIVVGDCGQTELVVGTGRNILGEGTGEDIIGEGSGENVIQELP